MPSVFYFLITIFDRTAGSLSSYRSRCPRIDPLKYSSQKLCVPAVFNLANSLSIQISRFLRSGRFILGPARKWS
jgi:hypothetical protein